MPKYIDADALLSEAKKLSGPHTGDGWDNWGVYALIERQPAVDVEPKREWIPVTERLPDTNEKVLVWVYDPDFYEPYMDFGYWLNEIEAWGEYNDDVGDFKYYTIIAWMPLPEPPKSWTDNPWCNAVDKVMEELPKEEDNAE